VTATARSAGAASLLQFLGSAAAKPVFEKHGFTVVE
jgi:ABC-type molybdate transport system substrate-binding protein